MTRKAILLAGGGGSRLKPATTVVNKQLLPVYDKPLIYYPLSVLFLAGIRDILIVCSPRDRSSFQALLGDGGQWGVALSYIEQPVPGGVAEALLLGADFIAGEPVCVILGDNLFHGHALEELLVRAAAGTEGCTLFACYVNDPGRYGVIRFDAAGRPLDIEEKPAAPRSHHAVTGLYFYDHRACELATGLTPSARGELEITDLNNRYLAEGRARVEILHRGYTWLDAGTPRALLEASSFVQIMQERQGLLVCCPEEIAWRRGWISDQALSALAGPLAGSDYGHYLQHLAAAGRR